MGAQAGPFANGLFQQRLFNPGSNPVIPPYLERLSRSSQDLVRVAALRVTREFMLFIPHAAVNRIPTVNLSKSRSRRSIFISKHLKHDYTMYLIYIRYNFRGQYRPSFGNRHTKL